MLPFDHLFSQISIFILSSITAFVSGKAAIEQQFAAVILLDGAVLKDRLGSLVGHSETFCLE
jgi:hypothetical protein